MIQKLKDNSLYIFALFILAICILQFQKCEQQRMSKAELARFDQTVTALNDSIKKSVTKNGDTVYTERTVSTDLEALTKTSFFKSLTANQQKFYSELKETKGLLASAYVIISKQDSILKQLSYGTGSIKTDTTVCFQYGSKLAIPKDTINNLTYSGDITFNKEKAKLELFYSYKTKIQSTYTRNKDGSILLTHNIDDPRATIVDGQSFLVPVEKKTFWQKTWKVTQDVLKIGSGVIIGYTAGKLSK